MQQEHDQQKQQQQQIINRNSRSYQYRNFAYSQDLNTIRKKQESIQTNKVQQPLTQQFNFHWVPEQSIKSNNNSKIKLRIYRLKSLLKLNINSQAALQAYQTHLKNRLRKLEEQQYCQSKMGLTREFEKRLNQQIGSFELTSIYYQSLLNQPEKSRVFQIGNMKRLIFQGLAQKKLEKPELQKQRLSQSSSNKKQDKIPYQTKFLVRKRKVSKDQDQQQQQESIYQYSVVQQKTPEKGKSAVEKSKTVNKELQIQEQRNNDVQSQVKEKYISRAMKKVKVKPIDWTNYQNIRCINFIKMAQTFAPQGTGLDMYKLWRKQFTKDTIKLQDVLKIQKISQVQFFTKYRVNQLLSLIQKYGKNWEKIAEYFDQNSASQVQKIYNTYKNNYIRKTGRWDQHKSIVLLVLIQHIGEGKWSLISRYFSEKTEIQIRERYCFVLNPELSKNDFSREEQNQLLQKAPLLQYKWGKMVAEIDRFKSRTKNCLRKKFRALLMDKSQDQIRRQIIGNQKLLNSVIEMKKTQKKNKKIKIG